MIEKNKESQLQSLSELQQELKSLKALLLSRGPSVSSGISTPAIPSKPSIPAWQSAGFTLFGDATGLSSPAPPAPPSHPPILANGKGKEIDSSSDAART